MTAAPKFPSHLNRVKYCSRQCGSSPCCPFCAACQVRTTLSAGVSCGTCTALLLWRVQAQSEAAQPETAAQKPQRHPLVVLEPRMKSVSNVGECCVAYFHSIHVDVLPEVGRRARSLSMHA